MMTRSKSRWANVEATLGMGNPNLYPILVNSVRPIYCSMMLLLLYYLHDNAPDVERSTGYHHNNVTEVFLHLGCLHITMHCYHDDKCGSGALIGKKTFKNRCACLLLYLSLFQLETSL